LIAVICGRQWKNETEDIKAHYKGMAEVLKKKHAQDNPGYVYNPRKPSDKKKRMTASRAAAMTSLASSAAGPSTHASTTVPASASVSVLPLSNAVVAAPGSAGNSFIAAPVIVPAANLHAMATYSSPIAAKDNKIHAADTVDEADDYQPPDFSHTDPVGLVEFENGSLGLQLPMSDEALGKLLKEHSDFLTAHPNYQVPLTRTNIAVGFTEDTADDIEALDDLMNWGQLGGDYHYSSGDNGDDFCSFFEEELERLVTPSE
jgi:HMG (high mobility group) box